MRPIVRTTITVDPDVYEEAVSICGSRNFSRMVTDLLRSFVSTRRPVVSSVDALRVSVQTKLVEAEQARSQLEQAEKLVLDERARKSVEAEVRRVALAVFAEKDACQAQDRARYNAVYRALKAERVERKARFEPSRSVDDARALVERFKKLEKIEVVS